MPLQWDSATGRFVDKERDERERLLAAGTPVARPAYGSSLAEQAAFYRNQEQNQKLAQTEADFRQKGGSDKPFLPSGPGGLLGDTLKVGANILAGIPTDIIDIGSGLVDIANEGKDWLLGGQFETSKLFDDSDNPLTKARRQSFEAESELGRMVSNIGRLVTPVSWFAKPFALAGKLPKLGQVAKVGTALEKTFGEVNHLDDTARVVSRLQSLAEGAIKGSPAQKLGSTAARNSWLTLTYKDVAQNIGKDAELAGAAAFFDDTRQSLKALGSFGKWSPERRLKTFGQAVAWDTFMALNVAGEGDDAADETVGDMLYGLDNPVAQFLGQGTMIRPEDPALIRKAKQGLENLIMAPVMNGVIDMIRVRRFATAYRKASPEARDQILKAMDLESQQLGESIAQLHGYAPAGLLNPAKDAFDTEQLWQRVNAERAAQDQQVSWQAQWAAARERQAIAQQGTQPLLTGGPADLNSPVQNRLAQMEGLASELNDDPLYQEWLKSREALQAPGPMQGPTPAPADDLPAYKAWLEDKARMPEAELDPRVQQSLRRLDGIGELAPMQQQQPGQLLQPGQIEPVTVQDLGSPLRPPEPVVTPQTQRAAVGQEIARRMPEVMVQGPDGVFRSITERVNQIAPRTRVDRIEYLKQFPLQMNAQGAFNAVDTVWYSNFVRQGLDEGWAKIDPDSFEVLYNRAGAATADRNAAVVKQAETLDELAQIQQYDIDIAESYRAAQQEQPLPIDVAQSEKLAAQEADPALAQATSDAIEAGSKVDMLDATEQARLDAATLRGLEGGVDDAAVVREMTGTTLDSLQRPEVLKSEAGRGWEVFDSNGELLGSARTKAAAEKIADRQLREDQKALVARARQMEADATDEPIDNVIGDPVVDSDVMGKVQMTDSQIAAVQGLLPRLDSLLDEAWLARRGDSGFFNINELGPQKRTFDLGQGDMRALASAIRNGLESGSITGPRARSLRNLADKLDTQVKLLEPQARAQRTVNGLIQDMQTFLDHGDFCDFI
jgi:hypothetical protein